MNEEKIENILSPLVSNGFDRNSTEKMLDDFLKHKSKKVLFLKGAWGVGKTHFWNKYINSKMNGSKNGVGEKRYSYVSLFGAENVKDIEELIIAGSINPTANDVRQSSEDLSVKIQDIIQDIPKLKEWSGLINRICRVAIDDTLICIDDLERKDKKLSLSVILGLVSILKELKNCRIVIIFNEDFLYKEEDGNDLYIKEDRKDLELYREKIVDQELTFAPSIENNLELIWKKNNDRSLYLPIFSKVNVNNIRVMQQTQWAIEYFSELLENSPVDIHPDLKRNLLEQVCFLTIFYHQKNLEINVLKLEDYYSISYSTMLNDKDKQTPEAKNIKKQLAKLHHFGFDGANYDNLIVNYLQNGKCDEESFKTILEQENKRFIESDIYKKKSSIWDIYWSNFKIKDNEVIRKFSNFVNDNINYLNFKELTDITEVIKKLDKSKKHEDDIEKWTSIVEQNYLTLSINEIISLLKTPFLNISDDLKKKLSDKVKENEMQKDIISIIYTIVEEQRWNQEIFTILNLKETNDYKKEFLNSDKNDLLGTLSKFYQMFSSSVHPEVMPIMKKVKQVLYEIKSSAK